MDYFKARRRDLLRIKTSSAVSLDRAVGGALDPAPSRASYATRTSTLRVLLAAVALLLPPTLYSAFVVRNSVNAIYWDEWNGAVPYIHAALHHSLTFSMLWQQHNENRMLVANLIFLLFGMFDHFDTRSIMILSAALFIASYYILLALWRPRFSRPSGAAAVLLVGLVWFSLEDFENSLWGFQLAWFLIVFLLMVMLLALGRTTIGPGPIVAAGAAAALASFCSLQGLILWPVGLLCILWRVKSRRRMIGYGLAWTAAAVASSVLYLNGLAFGTDTNGAFAIHHPVEMLQYFLAALGNLFPIGSSHLLAYEVVGGAILVCAVLVAVNCLRHHRDSHTLLPLALIVFAICFDVSLALGRLVLGVPEALASRYTLVNLMLLVGIAVHVFNLEQRSRKGITAAGGAALSVLVGMSLLAQIAIADHYGWTSGSQDAQARHVTARIEANLTRIPASQRTALFDQYVYPRLTGIRVLYREARTDHLGVFYPPVYRTYRRLGPP